MRPYRHAGHGRRGLLDGARHAAAVQGFAARADRRRQQRDPAQHHRQPYGPLGPKEAAMSNAPVPRGMYFEDFEIGQALQTGRRTITSTDIVNFACLSGDFNDVHTNHEYCKTTPFGEPIAHGPLVFAVAAGLNYASGINDGTLIALLGIDKWRMKKPVKHGDTIYVCTTVIGKPETS